MKKNNFLWLWIVLGSLFLVGIIGGIVYFAISGTSQSTLGSGEIVKLAIPHYGSFECKSFPDKLGQTINIASSSGVLLSKETIGFYTNGIKNIKIISQGALIKTRIRYSICDTNGNNCGSESSFSTQVAGTYYIPSLSSIDFSQQSIRIYSEIISIPDLWNYKYWDGNKITYDATPYELVYHSTTQDIAGSVVCPTSCDLTCPDIGIRDKLIFTQGNILGFGNTAPSFEYWESISYDLNAQGGATVYNANTNQFCFAGTIYNAKTTKMQDGDTYIFPDVNTRQYKTCCPGATISSTYSDKVCQSDYTWKTIADTDKVTCINDAVCPNAGNLICQDKQLSNGYSCVNKDTNGIGICQKASGNLVECCLNSDCNKDMTCDTSSHTCKGGSIYPVCGDGKLDSGEQCDDGNTISGDGCSSTCQSEVECRMNSDCKIGQTCKDNRCIGNEITCKWYQETTPEASYLFGLIKTESGCKTASWVFWAIIISIIFFFIGIIVLIKLIFNKLSGSGKKEK